jgi:2-dehydropantoate 2-reductase
VLRAGLPGRTVLTGMVPFNVVHRGPGAFHQGSEGALEVEDHPALAPCLSLFKRAGLPLLRHGDMQSVLWAKLLLNLNNAINALSNLPLKEELSQRAYRRCLALAQAEALRLLDLAGIKPAMLTPIPPQWIPRLLDVPDFLFQRLASKMLAIDPLARSSMWEDLQAGRKTEVDYLNGEVLRLAAKLGRTAPVNARLVALILEAEKGGRRQWTGEKLLEELKRG